MTILSTLLHATNFRNAILRTLVPSISLAFGLQAAVAVPSMLAQSERFYDLSGSLTYISCAALSLYLPALRARAAAAAASQPIPAWPSVLSGLTSAGSGNAFNWRQVALSLAVTVWATRLGSFLFARITADKGTDSRFDKIRGSPLKFLGAFMVQATWVSVCLLPVLAVNSVPASALATLPMFSATDGLGLILFLGGFAFEVVADQQKRTWLREKKEKKHDEDFLAKGLWSRSRHPNYFGEYTLWTGIATLSAGVLKTNAALGALGLGTGFIGHVVALSMAGASPAFVTYLLLKVSGVPMAEKSQDKKHGHKKEYQEWKQNTPVFFPRF